MRRVVNVRLSVDSRITGRMIGCGRGIGSRWGRRGGRPAGCIREVLRVALRESGAGVDDLHLEARRDELGLEAGVELVWRRVDDGRARGGGWEDSETTEEGK